MFVPLTIARTRITWPTVSGEPIARPRLEASLAALEAGGLAAVMAGPGFGKTTLLTAWGVRRATPKAWYSVAEGDDEPIAFAAHVLAAIDVARGRTDAIDIDPERWRSVLDAAINGACDLPGLVLVIDDAHRIVQAAEALTYLLRYLPPTAAVVLSGRRMPAIREWALWSARGRVRCTLVAAELALTTEETAAVVAARGGAVASSEGVRRLHDRVGGWPLGVDLVARTRGSIESAGSGPEGPQSAEGDLLDDCIAQEVFDELTADEMAFLIDCSVLESLTPAVCAAVSGRDDAGRVLTRLAELGLLSKNGDAMRTHKLFHDALIRRRAERRAESAGTGDATRDIAALHRRAALALEQCGQAHDAIAHRIEAGDVDAAVSALAALPLTRNRLLTLTDRLGAVVLDLHPALRVLRGRALRRSHAYEAAKVELERAAASAARLGSGDVEAEALAEQASIYVDTLQPAKARVLLRRAYRRTPIVAIDARVRIIDLVAENCVNQGRAAAALRFRRLAGRLRTRSASSALDARILLRTGQLAAARATAEGRLAAHATASGATTGDGGEASSEPEAHREEVLVLAYIAALEGDVATAERAARQGLEAASASCSVFTEAVSYMRLGHALQLRPDASFEETVNAYARAQALAERTGVERLRVEALMGLALAYAAKGDVPRSYAFATDGLVITMNAGDLWLSAWLRLVTGIAGHLGGHPDAAGVLEAARADMAACRDVFGLSVAELWLALAGRREMPTTLAAMADRGHAFLMTRPTLFGPRTPVPETPSPDIGWRLRLQCLGPFRAWRGTDEIANKTWKREKARELFLFLLTRRGQLVQKEALMDLLWPDATPEAANRDFRVALHALSEAVDPERPKNALARCLERRGTAYCMLAEADLEVDVDEMERLIARGTQENRPELWQRAIELYRGDFLEDLPYAEWAASERDRLRGLYVGTAEKLARHAFEQGDDDGAMGMAHAIIARDRCWEEAWRIIIRVHNRQGRPALAQRAYDDCVAALDDELGLAPSPETQALAVYD